MTSIPAFTRITGYTREEVLGKSPGLLSSGRQDTDFYRAMWQSIHDNGHWSGEIWNRRKNGEGYAQMLSVSTVTDSAGAVQHLHRDFCRHQPAEGRMKPSWTGWPTTTR